MKKKTRDIKKLTLRQEVIRTLTSAELKIVIGAAVTGNSDTTHSKGDDGSPTTC